MRRSRARLVAAAGIVALLVTPSLTSCKASAVGDYHYTTSDNVTRCVTGQSVVGETADQTAAGSVVAAATTKTMRDLFCSNTDNLHPAWKDLGVMVELWKKRADGSVFLCAGGDMWTTTATTNSVDQSVANRCGAGNYYAIGSHPHVAFYGDHSATWHVFNTLTPLGWND